MPTSQQSFAEFIQAWSGVHRERWVLFASRVRRSWRKLLFLILLLALLITLVEGLIFFLRLGSALSSGALDGEMQPYYTLALLWYSIADTVILALSCAFLPIWALICIATNLAASFLLEPVYRCFYRYRLVSPEDRPSEARELIRQIRLCSSLVTVLTVLITVWLYPHSAIPQDYGSIAVFVGRVFVYFCAPAFICAQWLPLLFARRKCRDREQFDQYWLSDDARRAGLKGVIDFAVFLAILFCFLFPWLLSIPADLSVATTRRLERSEFYQGSVTRLVQNTANLEKLRAANLWIPPQTEDLAKSLPTIRPFPTAEQMGEVRQRIGPYFFVALLLFAFGSVAIPLFSSLAIANPWREVLRRAVLPAAKSAIVVMVMRLVARFLYVDLSNPAKLGLVFSFVMTLLLNGMTTSQPPNKGDSSCAIRSDKS